MRAATVDTYDWVPGQPGVLEVRGTQAGFSRPARFVGWLGGDPVFLVARQDEFLAERESADLDGVFQVGGPLRVSFAEQALPPAEGKLTLLQRLPDWEMLQGMWGTWSGDDLVIWVRSDLRQGSMLDEVLGGG